MSALIKSIRLRRSDDALKWFVALWSFPSLRERVVRRILISSGEDGFSHELIAKVARWYRGPHRLSERHAAAEVLRICGTPSWWASTEGHEYIFAWLSAEQLASGGQLSSFVRLEAELDEHLAGRALIPGIAAFIRMSLHAEFLNVRLMDQFGRWVDRLGDERTLMLYDEWRAVARILGRDGNIGGFLLYDLLGGIVPNTPLPDVSLESVQLTALRQAWDGRDASVPAWANDGIHARAAGVMDKRFAGLVPNFARMCQAYAIFGRLAPDDHWDALRP